MRLSGRIWRPLSRPQQTEELLFWIRNFDPSDGKAGSRPASPRTQVLRSRDGLPGSTPLVRRYSCGCSARIFLQEAIDRIENDVGHRRFRANSLGIIKFSAVEAIWIAAENLLPAGCKCGLRLDTEQNRDMLVPVQSVSDEKGDDDNAVLRRIFSPVSDKGSFFHVSLGYLRVPTFATDLRDLTLRRFGGLLIQARPVTDDQQARLIRTYIGSDPPGAAEDEVHHSRIVTYGITVANRFAHSM